MHGSLPQQTKLSATTRREAKRRPSGLSRRRKRQYSFETLEDRRVMSAQSPVATLVQVPLSQWQATSFSSNSLEGQMAILQREILRQASLSTGLAANTTNVTNSIPTDPLLSYQWHLINSGQQVGNPDFQNIFGLAGQDVNVAPVWNMGYTGDGVRVAVFDSGVQLNHPDLIANLSPTLGYDPLANDFNASPEADYFDPNLNQFRVFVNAHGTAVAGIIGAVANNGIGGVGVAPGVELVPIRIIDAGQTDQAFVNAFQYATLNGVDIANHSWGPGVIRGLAGPSPAETLALRDSIFFGRDGLGVIHVFSSGNSGEDFDSSSYNGWVNSRYTIGVTAVDHDGFYNNIDGTVTGYPEIGAAVLVAAPTGSFATLDIVNDTGLGSGIVTTDTTDGLGPSGFNVGVNPTNGQEYDRDFFDDNNYTSRFNGTSAAAPMVTGVIALMLEANPNLTWRDVQEILVRSARQNAVYGEAQNGADKAFDQSFSNTWIVNQLPLFHDPDPYDPAISPALQTYQPTLNPNITRQFSTATGRATVGNQLHYAPSPAMLTNGAGYTVSMGFGTNNEWIGYGHGVVDAELAVKLAEQWSVKSQALPQELTWTTEINTFLNGAVPAAQSTGDLGGYVVPGGLGGQGTWIDYYQEFWDPDDPFAPDELQALYTGARSAGYVELKVPDDGNTMAVETVEVTLNIDNWAAAMDHLRVALVSPSGTKSELNQFWVAGEFADDWVQIDGIGGYGLNAVSPNNLTPLTYGAPGSLGGAVSFTLSTKRHWGERSDTSIMYDAFTGDPIIDTDIAGDAVFNPGANPVIGDLLQQGWQLHFENWGTTALNIASIEVAFHGRPIAANSERIQGFVGVDDNRDALFNYSRVLRDTASETLFSDLDPTTVRLGEVVNMVDPNQETFAANVTVTARRLSDNQIVGQFVTGHDGNFYFDLVPDDYLISVEDPLGRTAIDDTLTPALQLDHFRNEWIIKKSYFTAWDADPFAPAEILVDANGDPIPFIDANGNTTVTGMRNINFLLDPSNVANQEIIVNGSVYADITGNGNYDGNDVYLPAVTVFADVNRDGVQNPGEIAVQTDSQGNYTLTVPWTSSGVINIGVKSPTGWTATKPVTIADPNASLFTEFAQPGDTFDLPDFALKPPADNAGGGGANLPGYLIGVVYNDVTQLGTRQASEGGAANIQVYIDANNNGTREANETLTTTNSNGAFVFANVAPGQRVIRTLISSPIVQTAPAPGTARIVTLAGSSTISTIIFGVRNTATEDYGDLPLIYGATTLAQNGARHRVGGYYLGAPGSNDVDAELDGQPSANANGDDLAAPVADEDGITFGAIVPGSSTQLTVLASQSGYLQGWIDWNNDGDFSDVGERVLTDKGLVAGSNAVSISVPASANIAQVYARFRFGAFGINSINGSATFGEVEDYQLNVALPAVPQVIGLAADADGDGRVNGNDFLAWQRNLGRQSGATQSQGDSNGDGRVSGADLINIKDDFGAGSQPAAVVLAPTGDFDGDGAVNGSDLLAWQRGLGLAHPSLGAGDANHDGSTNAADLGVWKGEYGASAASASFVASAYASSSNAALLSTGRPAAAAPRVADAAFVADDQPAAATSAAKVLDAFKRNPFEGFGEGRAQRTAYRPGRAASEAIVPGSVAQLATVDHVDRAFDDLLGSRRRQGLQAEVELLEAGDELDCDEAFAVLADHFDWTAG